MDRKIMIVSGFSGERTRMPDDTTPEREEGPVMELSFDKKANLQERLAFVRQYAAWILRTPDAEWSRQQADLIDSFIENARNMPLSKEAYLKIVDRRKRSIHK
jgi:hypothetical protein